MKTRRECIVSITIPKHGSGVFKKSCQFDLAEGLKPCMGVESVKLFTIDKL